MGVTNYTRPLMEHLSKDNNMKVSYLYNDCFDNKISLKKNQLEFTQKNSIDFIELRNGQSNLYNYNSLNLDYDSWFDNNFKIILDKIQPDIIHINEIFGFSSKIILLAQNRGIKIIISVHEYWWLCPHRVMVDFNNRICEGPNDFDKCVHCIKNKMPRFGTNNERIKYYLKNNVPIIYEALKYISKGEKSENKISYSFHENRLPTRKSKLDKKLKNDLSNRLIKNIEYLNQSNLNIAVSNDVKRILIKYGVHEDKILVNHIGSNTSNRVKHIKPINKEEIIFGFIGGVSYYKGVHQLIQAWQLLPVSLKKKSKIYVYGKYDESYYNYIIDELLINEIYKENVVFFGSFLPKDLEKITNTFDISVLPSLCADTAPQTIFESFNSGLPIIAPNIGGYPDFITDGKNGFLYEKESFQDLALKLERIISMPNLIDHFKAFIPNLKSFEQHITEILHLYNSI